MTGTQAHPVEAAVERCARCGRPVPAFTDAALRHWWQRGHEERCPA